MERLTAEKLVRMSEAEAVIGRKSAWAVSAYIDSRKVTEKSVFFAIPGSQTDGHKFINSAVENGADIIFTEIEPSMLDINERARKATFIKTDSTMRSLAVLARNYLKKFGVPVICVTGSVGKTSTKEMIYTAISQKYRAHKSEGNYNSETGLPLSVLKMKKGVQCAVFELGMDAAGEIDYLTKIAQPSIAVITNIGVSHIESLGSRENILKAKLEIENGLSDRGILVLNGDDELLYSVRDSLRHKVIYYGINNDRCDMIAYDITTNPLGTHFGVKYKNKAFDFEIPVFGRHNVLNAMAAIICGFETGVKYSEIKKGLNRFKNIDMRQNIYETDGVTIIEDCYNASPDSMKAAFDVVAGMDAGRKIAFLGDMLELGEKSAEYHTETGALAKDKFDYLIGYGKMAEYYCKGAADKGMDKNRIFFCSSKREAESRLLEIAEKGSIILFKASRGMNAEECIKAFKEGWNVRCR